MTLAQDLAQAARTVREQAPLTPKVGIVLGSGLGAWADTLTDRAAIPYERIPEMPRSAVVGHAGNLVVGHAGAVPVACLQGRVHMYEGHSPERVVFGVRLLAELGCEAVLLTNAAGGIDAAFEPGSFMLITDHLNMTGKSPLLGPNDASVGPRFPDMTHAYDPGVCAAARLAAKEQGVSLHEGVYAGMLGPTYETPAEVRMLRTLGAHAVGMSTVPEIIALRHQGVPAGAISCITNLAAGISKTELNHAEVEETAKRTHAMFVKLLSSWVSHTAASVQP